MVKRCIYGTGNTVEQTPKIISVVHKIHIRHDVLLGATNVWHNHNVRSGISVDTTTDYSFSECGVTRKFTLKRQAIGVELRTNETLKYNYFTVWVNPLNAKAI